MTKSELIERIVSYQGQLSSRDVELAIKTMLEQMAQALSTGDRIEIRGFGSFSLHYRAPVRGVIPRPANRCCWTASSFRTSSLARSCETGSTSWSHKAVVQRLSFPFPSGKSLIFLIFLASPESSKKRY